MERNCLKCGKAFKVKPYKFEITKYCNKICASKKVTVECSICKKEVVRTPCGLSENTYCGRACSKIGTSKRMTEMNKLINVDRMTLETRTKLRAAHVGKGDGKAYRKTFGVHTHRLVASEKLGRPLLKGEVVHHIDENILNNHPDNLHVFASQAEHAAHHNFGKNK